MDALSCPMATTGSAAVTPMRLAQGRSTSSVSSATMPGQGAYQFAPSPLLRKPVRLPKDIFITASASPFSAAQAAFTLPARAKPWNDSQAFFCPWAVPSPAKRYTGCPGSLNSGVSVSPARRGAMAKEIRVGGTSKSRNEPDMESLPPMAAQP